MALRRRLGLVTAAVLVVAGSLWALPGAGAPGLPAVVTVWADHPMRPINQQLVGVDGPGPVGAEPAMAALGMRWVRLDASFEGSFGGVPGYDCTTGTFNPAGLDARVAGARAEGAQPEVIVDYTPACLATTVNPFLSANYQPPDATAADQGAWDHLVYEMAYHEITAEGVRTFEIWNEPDNFFWAGGLSGYEHLYQDTATVLESAARAAGTSIEVGGPALFYLDPLWVDPFLSFVSANHLPLDFFSWHFYADFPLFGPIGPIGMPPSWLQGWWYNPLLSPESYGQQVDQLRQDLAGFPSLHPLLWIDEWNADAGYDARMEGPYDAAFAAATLDSVQSAGLDRMAFFDVSDSPTDPRGDWGLLTGSLQPKAVYQTFWYWHEMDPTEVPALVWFGGQDLAGRVGAVASRGPGGQVTVLVYNFTSYSIDGNYGTSDPTPYDRTVLLRVDGLAPVGYRWSRQLTDAAHQGGVVATGLLAGTHPALRFTLAGEGVTLVTLTPRGTPPGT